MWNWSSSLFLQGARVICAETTSYRVKTGGEKKQGTEATFTSTYLSSMYTTEDWIFIVRLYLDGVYAEPPSEMLTAVPDVAQSACLIS